MFALQSCFTIKGSCFLQKLLLAQKTPGKMQWWRMSGLHLPRCLLSFCFLCCWCASVWWDGRMISHSVISTNALCFNFAMKNVSMLLLISPTEMGFSELNELVFAKRGHMCLKSQQQKTEYISLLDSWAQFDGLWLFTTNSYYLLSYWCSQNTFWIKWN